MRQRTIIIQVKNAVSDASDRAGRGVLGAQARLDGPVVAQEFDAQLLHLGRRKALCACAAAARRSPIACRLLELGATFCLRGFTPRLAMPFDNTQSHKS